MTDSYDLTVARLIRTGDLTDAPDVEDPESWRDDQDCRWLRQRRGEDWFYLAVWRCTERGGWLGQAVLVAAEDMHVVAQERRFRGPVEAGGDALRRLRETSQADVLGWLPDRQTARYC